jgi:sigma-B regulation protein RsbU (phosphoserine phosphatase)
MRIRWKLLLLLVTISLGPLAVALWVGRNAATSLADDLATGTREALVEDAERFLLHTVQDQGRHLLREGEMLDHNLRIQAREVERCLADAPPSTPEIHFVEDFETEGRLAELVLSDRYVRVAEDGTRVPMPVSYAHQSFLLAPGVDRKEVAGDVARLSATLPACQLVYGSQPGLIQWLYTTLQSGVHAAYPGHGYYAAGFDPRQRLWYRNAQERGRATWNPPIVDASTRQVILTRSMPVHAPDGSFAGVTAIDVRITDLVQQIELPAEWARDAEKMIVFPSDTSTGQRAIRIIAQQDFEAEDEWDVLVADRMLVSADERQLEQMCHDVAGQKAAVRNMPYQGRQSLWAYGPLHGTSAALLVIVPQEHVVAPALAAEAQVRLRMAQHRTVTATIVAVVVVAVVVLSLLASRHVTRPIQELAAAAHRIADGDLETPTRITTHDELGELGATVNAMLPQLRDRIKLKQSLSLAMEVQQSLLPLEAPRVAGLDIAGKSIYCDETGGDYYDFVDLSALSPHTLGVAVGDVTGHGIAAALLMATARALLRSRADQPGSLGDVLNHINRHLAEDVPIGKFMTLSYLLLDTQARTVRWTNAGHDPAIVYAPATDSFSELDGGGIPLGIEPGWQYEELGPRSLEPGQVIVIGTDGVWEARNAEEHMFGKARVRTIIRAAADRSAREISAGITDGIASFRGSRFPDDDITLVVIKVESG